MSMDMDMNGNTGLDEEKIKGILNDAIKNKEDKIKQIKNDIIFLNKQREQGMIDTFTNIENIDSDSDSAQKLGLAVIAIIYDILTGVGDAVNRIRADEKSRDIQKGAIQEGDIQKGAFQKGGNDKSGDDKSKDGTTKSQAQDSFNDTTKSLSDAVQKSKDKITDISNKITTGELGSSSMSKSIGSDIISKIKDMGEASIKTGIMWYANYINELIDRGMEFTGVHDILSTPINELSPELNKKIVLFAVVLNEISNNPATREAVKEIAEAIAITAVEILKEIRPELNKITDQSLDMFQEASDKAVRGATATGIGVAKAGISEIPFVGGVINLMLAIGKGFNVVMETYEVVVDKGGPIVVNTAKMGKGIEDTVNNGKKRIEDSLANANKKISKSDSDEDGIELIDFNADGPVKPLQGGGCKKTNNGINKCGKRLRKTMKMFSSTLPKLQFPLSSSYKIQKNGRKSRKNGRKR